MTTPTTREVELTRPQRQLLRRIIREEARRMGYGTTYHDIGTYENGPNTWPPALTELGKVMRKLGRG